MCVGYFDSRQNHIYPFDGKLRATLLLVFKPLAERLDLFLRVGREQMFDCHVRWRDENRFRVRESVEAGLAIVVPDAGGSDAAERHGFDEQMYVHLVDCAATERQTREEVVDRFLITTEKEGGKRFRVLLHLTDGDIHISIDKDWEKRSKDFVFHDRIVPGNGVNDGGIDVACLRVGRAASDDVAFVDKACETFNRLGTYDVRVVVGSVPRIIPVQLDDGFFAPLNEFLGNGFMHISVSGCSAPLAAPIRCTPD